jgi:hypothetical protein
MKMLWQRELMVYLKQNFCAAIMMTLMMLQHISPGVLPFTTTGEGIVALTGKYLMRYIGNMDRKYADGKTTIKNQNLPKNQPNSQRTKNIFFSCGGYKNIFLPSHTNNLIQDVYLTQPIPGFIH